MTRTPKPVAADDLISVTLKVTPALHDALFAAAGERGLSVSLIGARAIAYYLERLIPVDQLQLTYDGPTFPSEASWDAVGRLAAAVTAREAAASVALDHGDGGTQS